MDESGPLWFRAVVASIPLLVAVIAGAFALINTVNSRTERLKNLVEIQKGILRVLNQDYMIERVMIRELNAIEKSTTPWYVLRRRRIILASVVLYPVLVLYWFNGHLFKLSRIESDIVNGAGTALAIIYLLSLRVWQKDRNRVKEMVDRQEARLKLLDSLAALPERRDTESPPTDTDRSQANDAKATDATSDTDANSPRSGD